jgi:hypothetical protein
MTRHPLKRFRIRPRSAKYLQGSVGGEYVFLYRGREISLPGRFVQDPTSPDGLRWIAMRESAKVIRSIVRDLANSQCELQEAKGCWGWTPLEFGHAHHAVHKKLGGAFADDRIWVAGERIRLWTCPTCHEKHHGKLHWGRKDAA